MRSRGELRHRGHGARHGEAGMSLIEVVVGMALAGVLMSVIGAIFMTSITAMGDQRARTSISAESRIAMESVARRARVAIRPAGEATAIVTATPTRLTLYASVTPSGATAESPPIKAEYYLDRGCLMEARTPARRLASPGPTGQIYAWDTGRAASCLAHLRGEPAFTYYDTAALTGPDGTDVAPMAVPTAGLSAASRALVRSVGLRLAVADPARADAGVVDVSTRVALSNLAADAIGG